MVQMVGVVIFGIGVPDVFASIDEGVLNKRVMVVGYIIMRLAMVAQWLRVAVQSPRHRRAALTYLAAVVIAQIGWTVQAFAGLSLRTTVVFGLVLLIIEMSGPALAERLGRGTPWHPHHIAERYSLMAIMTLGECVLGTMATVSALVHAQHHWSLDAALSSWRGSP